MTGSSATMPAHANTRFCARRVLNVAAPALIAGKARAEDKCVCALNHRVVAWAALRIDSRTRRASRLSRAAIDSVFRNAGSAVDAAASELRVPSLCGSSSPGIELAQLSPLVRPAVTPRGTPEFHRGTALTR